jgi:hypothetical protein
MTFAQLLNELARQGIAITITTNSIKTNVPASKIPEPLKEALWLNKEEVIATMLKPLKTFETCDNLVEAAIALEGVVSGEVPENVITIVYEDGTRAIQGPGDEFPF